MSEYTPDTGEVRELFWSASGTRRRDPQAWGEFDRWLADHDRRIAENAYDEGVEIGRYYAEDMEFAPLNPYRYTKETNA